MCEEVRAATDAAGDSWLLTLFGVEIDRHDCVTHNSKMSFYILFRNENDVNRTFLKDPTMECDLNAISESKDGEPSGFPEELILQVVQYVRKDFERGLDKSWKEFYSKKNASSQKNASSKVSSPDIKLVSGR